MRRDALTVPATLPDLLAFLLARRQVEAALALSDLHPHELPPAVILPILLAHTPALSANSDETGTWLRQWCEELAARVAPPAILTWRQIDGTVCEGSALARAIELGQEALITRWANQSTPAVQVGDTTLGLASWTVRCGRLNCLKALANAGQLLPDRASAWTHLRPGSLPKLTIPALAEIGGLPAHREAFREGRANLAAWEAEPRHAAWAKQMLAALQFAVAPGSPDLPAGLAEVFAQALTDTVFSYEQSEAVAAYPLAQVLPLRHTVEEGAWQGARWSLPAALVWSDLQRTNSYHEQVGSAWARVHGAEVRQQDTWLTLMDEVILDAPIAGQASPLTLRGLSALNNLTRWMDVERNRRGDPGYLVPPVDAERTWPALMAAWRHALVRNKGMATVRMDGYWAIWGHLTHHSNTSLPADVHRHLAVGFREQDDATRQADLVAFLRLGQAPTRWAATEAILTFLATQDLTPATRVIVRDSLVRAIANTSGDGWALNEDLPRNRKHEVKAQRRMTLLEEMLRLSQMAPTLTEAQVRTVCACDNWPRDVQATLPDRMRTVMRHQALEARPVTAPKAPRRRV